MALVDIRELTIRFPVYGADSRSFKRQITGVVGGTLGRDGPSSPTLVEALHEVTVRLTPGDRLGLIGHNGAGKTTLLRAMCGAYAPDGGSVLVEGKIASLLEPMLGMDLFVTGLENIRLRGLLMGLTSQQIKDRTEEIAEFTGLGAFLDLPLKTYSAGMIGRLAFAISTAVDADILLMDEWLGAGDANFRQQAHDRLMTLFANSKIVVLASHDMKLLRDLCNKFLMLSAGKATAVMTREELDTLEVGGEIN
jgi:lipopolysaccharide transport system ATP-binding protein